MALDAAQVAQNVLKEPRYRGHGLKYRLRWSIGHYLCQHPAYIASYFDKHVHEHVAYIDAIEAIIRMRWQSKATKTRQGTKCREIKKLDESRQLRLQF